MNVWNHWEPWILDLSDLKQVIKFLWAYFYHWKIGDNKESYSPFLPSEIIVRIKWETCYTSVLEPYKYYNRFTLLKLLNGKLCVKAEWERRKGRRRRSDTWMTAERLLVNEYSGLEFIVHLFEKGQTNQSNQKALIIYRFLRLPASLANFHANESHLSENRCYLYF